MLAIVGPGSGPELVPVASTAAGGKLAVAIRCGWLEFRSSDRGVTWSGVTRHLVFATEQARDQHGHRREHDGVADHISSSRGLP